MGYNLVYGVGINDMPVGTCSENNRDLPFYKSWCGMLERCYSSKLHLRNPAYVGCVVCDEWLILSNYKIWYDENHVDGYQLDKDLLVDGNKIYSPESCVFVTRDLNNLIKKFSKNCGKYGLPMGVTYNKPRGNYMAQISLYRKNKYLGSFKTAEEAHEVYSKVKAEHIIEVVESLRGVDDDRVVDVLIERYKSV